ncbi:TonB-dependent receptor [Pseudohongiella sp. O18]|uniref:TonB-dependent receptor n=1 Tax=Pseudohongiella sp. O18 TaxID=2904248 RepID=UPI001F275294|nr:TonB-dependent receptor [Pseudohongiella sp. O18]
MNTSTISKQLSLASAIATIIGASWSGAALAQTAGSAVDQNEVVELIVTGSRTPERLDEVTASVTVVDSEALRQDLQLTAELQNILSFRVPGLAPTTNSTSNFGQTLRGRTTLVMIDGVPQSTPLRNGALDVRTIDPAALQRVEVVKGATSIYGNGAAGGIINYITREAGGEAFNVELTQQMSVNQVESDDSTSFRSSATVDGTLGRFSYVFNATVDDNGLQRDAEGDIIGQAIYGLSGVRTQSLFGKLGFQIDAEKSLSLTANYYDAEQVERLIDVTSSINDGTKTYAVKPAPGQAIPGEPQGVDGNTNLMLQYRDAELFANTSLTVDAYTQEIENVFFYSATFADPAAGFSGGNSVILSEKEGLRLNLESVFDLNGVETTFIYGADILNDVTSQPLADGRSWVPEMDMSNEALYLQSKFVIGDWVLKAGVRDESVDIDVPDYTTLRMCGANNVCRGGNPVEGGKLSYSDTTYNAGLRYNVSPAFSPFVSYSQGFDVSDLGLLLRAASVPDLDQVQTEASVIDHYELGVSGRVGAFNYEFAIYESESELGTATVENPPGSGLYVPVRAPQEIEGWEVALGLMVNEHLDLGTTYTYVEGQDPDTGVYLDARKISPPKFTAWADYDLGNGLSASAQWMKVMNRDRFVPVDMATGRYTGAEAPVEGYDVFNLSARYGRDSWRASLGIENLFNEAYFPARAQAFTYSGYNTMGVGRTIKAGLTVEF